jgi:class 3 adenylate cyclase/CHASE2 domain-containing sensor protein
MLYEPALEMAARSLAKKPERAEQLLAGPRAPLIDRLERAVDRQKVLKHIRAAASLPLPAASRGGWPDSDDPKFPPSDFALQSPVGFADVLLDADGALRRMPLVAIHEDRVVVHQALAAALLHLGAGFDQLNLEKGRLRVSSERTMPLDREGRLVINWPMNRREKWDAAIPQISLSDLLELAQYEGDLHTARHDLRHNIAVLDKELATGLDCETWLLDILGKYAAGKPEFAAKTAAWFDGELIPQFLKHPKARPLFQQDAVTSTPLSPRESGRGEGTATVIQEQLAGIQQLEAEYRQAFAALWARVAGKLCLVGDTTTASTDLKLTPVGPEVPGVAAIVAAVNTMLTGEYLHVADIGTSAGLTIALGVMLALVFQRVPALPSIFLALAAVAAVFYGHLLLLERSSVLAGPVLPLAGVVACYFTVTTLRWWEEFREKRRIREAFQHYLHPTVVDQVSRHPELLKLGGEQANLTVLFSDIRGFSSISEQLSAPDLVRLLNEYLTAMTQIVFADGGTLDKYIGDAIMAFYGAPVPSDQHAYQACRTALAMTARLRDLQRGWRERGLPVLQIGIGLNTADVVVGNMGSDIRFDYTVMGDGVNLASRLEGATKFYGADILISENTWERVRDRIASRELDLIQVKGKDKPTRIFEVLGYLPLSAETAQRTELFHQALHAYRARKFPAARELFARAAALSPDDAAARLYIERCEAFHRAPPPADWDGVYAMTTK